MVSFLLKWLINVAIVAFLLVFYTEATFLGAFACATLLTIVSYVVVDRFILRVSNNSAASVFDAVLAYLFLWVAAYAMNWTLSYGALFFMAVFFGAVEAFIHRYILPTDFRVLSN